MNSRNKWRPPEPGTRFCRLRALMPPALGALGEELPCNIIAFSGNGRLAVRAVLSGFHELHLCAWQLLSHLLHFSRFRARIQPAVQQECRCLPLAEPPVVSIFIRRLHGIDDAKPSPAISSQHGWPPVWPVILSQQALRFFTQIFRLRGEAFEESARRRLFPKKMYGFQNHARAALRRLHSHHGGNYRAIAVPPENGPRNSERVKKREHLLRSFLMEVERHFAVNAA